MKSSYRVNKHDAAFKLGLEEVIGLTTKNGNGLASSGLSSKCAYLAGSVVVVYDVNLGTQSHLMVSYRLPKPLSCVAMSRDGHFVAAGEAGSQSSVLIWDSSTSSIVSELKGHVYGVACICFSPNGKHLVSVGGYIYLWEWRSGELITKVKATSACSTVSNVSFSSDAKLIVTAGEKHLKFWVLGSSRSTQINGTKGRPASIVIHEKPTNLAIHKGSSCIYIASSVWKNSSYDNCKQAGDCLPIYALTNSGILYLVHSSLSLKKSVTLKVQKAFALSTSGKLVACACNNGAVQLFTPMSLEYLGNILYSEETAIEQDFQKLLALPDAVACQFSGLEKLVSAGTFERDAVKANLSKSGFRSLAVSSDGKHLAAGDCRGNLHIYNLQTSDYTCFQGAHDAEILTLSFSQDMSDDIAKNSYFLASGGRDCIIHLYDVGRNFDLIGSIDDHSAAVTSVNISSNSCRILSCSADSFLVLRDVVQAENGHNILQQHRQKASKFGTVYDMAVDWTCENVVTVGQDKKIKIFNTASQKLIRSYTHDKTFGEPIKVIMDPSCTYVVCSFSNKSICIYDLNTGEIVAKAIGHAEIVTGVIFLPDCKRIVSVDGDGCIFVWKLPAPLSSKILRRIMERTDPLGTRNLAQPLSFRHICSAVDCQNSKVNLEGMQSLWNNTESWDGLLCPKSCHKEASSFKFSISRLPRWAQSKVTSPNSVFKNLNYTSLEADSTSSPEVQMPSDDDSSLPKTLKSQCSSTPCRSFSNIALDNQWRAVYTVCMDSLSSPEMHNLMNTKFQEIPLSLKQDKAAIRKDQNSLGFSSHCENEELGVVSEEQVDFNNSCISSLSSEEISDIKAEQLHLDESVSESKPILEANIGSLHCEEDSDMFKQHFGSLSNTHKTESRNSVVRRFSTRYVVQQDYPGDCKRLFISPVRHITNKSMNSEEKAANYTLSKNRSLQDNKIDKLRNSSKQDPKNSPHSLLDLIYELDKCPAEESSSDNKMQEGSNETQGVFEGNEVAETISACKEAFGSLDAAAESVVQLLSKLEKCDGGEASRGAGAQFLNEASQLLPLIIEKVNAVSKLVECRKSGKQGNRLGVPELDQLFAS
ncbi:mitogen-activated protein kinase-binding protein 1 isoform X3 [Arachis ipaensis]|uniref:mitogen-activated protein kinase-binding protein 1 isoform X3 n=1 Tax=Arachis ipaensis TaxID=130454 RepID=UPI000A2B779C|nr:mitogen-activated protein kinase-binding protein 1 isoform X3 [Arachis ipaensis]